MFPLAFRRVAFAAALLVSAGVAGAQTPAFAPSVIGKPLVLEGKLEVLVEDYADGRSITRHFLRTAMDRIPLQFAGDAPQLSNSTRVRVHGTAQADALAVDAGKGRVETLATVLPNTMGEQSIAVLLVNFQDDTSQPKTIAQAQDLVFGEVSNHYRESSFGQTWFKGDTFGWYTIAMSKNTCDPYTLASLADAQAKQQGVNLSAYQRRVYLFPANSCLWLGLGHIGGTSTQAWVNGQMTLHVAGHELGHNVGLYHARSLDCDTTTLGVAHEECITYAYGDAADMMGNINPGQFSAFQKEQLGWLNDGISPPITTVAASGRYSIEPYSATTPGTKALKFRGVVDPLGYQRWYYLEYRQPSGDDAVLANVGNLTKGVLVHTSLEGKPSSITLLDMHPGTSTKYYEESADGALAVGERFYDPDSGISLTLASANSAGADIDVEYGTPTCTRAAPDVWIGPLGNDSAGAAGTTLKYAVAIGNFDSLACAPTTFDLASIIPTGWTSTVDIPNLTVKAGMVGYAELSVTSVANAALGEYKIWASASSAASALHTAKSTLPAYYVVSLPCVHVAPTVALSGGGAAVRAGTTVPYTLTVTNRDSAQCAPTNFALAGSVPAGWTGTLHKTSVPLGPGQSATVGLDVTSNAAATVGSYGIGAAMSSPVGALHTANASATYDVASTCTRAAPTVSLIGGGTPVAGGTAVGYALSVTNRDSDACPSTTFSLARSVPAGWASTMSRTAVALSPGASETATLNVTSPTTVTGGSYGIGAAVSSPLGATHTVSAATHYVLAPKLSISDVSMIEGTGGNTTANFVVSLTAPAVVPVTFNIATANGTAAAGSDYTATSLTGVTIPVGSSNSTVSVPVIGDTTVEANETFQVGITGVVGATVSDGTAIATIRNDDTVLSIGDVAIVEGNSGTKAATFTVKLSRVSASPVSFNIATANNTAAAGSDYVARNLAAQTIIPGATGMTFTVSIAGDAAVESNETFFVNVSNVKGATVGDAQAVGTIRNDDTVLSITDASITEGQSGTKVLTFTVKLSAISAAPVSFNLATANKTAAAGTDYVALALAGQSIPAGTMSKVFAVTIKGDTVKEVNETFVVNVSAVAAAIVGDAQGLGTIVNDD